ncbi:MAG: hypothetical protein HC923_01105 [Myxococcales bacterium]|nr:hypothetical protein [Myxococcales bacterium]
MPLPLEEVDLLAAALRLRVDRRQLRRIADEQDADTPTIPGQAAAEVGLDLRRHHRALVDDHQPLAALVILRAEVDLVLVEPLLLAQQRFLDLSDFADLQLLRELTLHRALLGDLERRLQLPNALRARRVRRVQEAVQRLHLGALGQLHVQDRRGLAGRRAARPTEVLVDAAQDRGLAGPSVAAEHERLRTVLVPEPIRDGIERLGLLI